MGCQLPQAEGCCNRLRIVGTNIRRLAKLLISPLNTDEKSRACNVQEDFPALWRVLGIPYTDCYAHLKRTHIANDKVNPTLTSAIENRGKMANEELALYQHLS